MGTNTPIKFIWSRLINNVIDKINFIGVFLPITPIKFISWRSQIASSEGGGKASKSTLITKISQEMP